MINLSIIIPSYNRAQYIGQTLYSIFQQKTDYKFQIIVADDCSTDDTAKIIRQYQKRYPDTIILLESEKNQMLYKNILRAYSIIKTDYFCVIDPDDFWIDDLKIQKALSFLEAHKDYIIYATATLMLNQDNTLTPFISGEEERDSDFEDYLNCNVQLGCTLGGVFRNVIFKNAIPKKMLELERSSQENSFRGDSFRNIIHLHEGKCHFVPDFDGVYRVTDDGLWQKNTALNQSLLSCLFRLDMFYYYDKKYINLLLQSFQIYSLDIKPNMTPQLALIKDEKERKKIMMKIIEIEKIFKFYKLEMLEDD